MAPSDQPDTTRPSAGAPATTGIQTPPTPLPLPPSPATAGDKGGPALSLEEFTRTRGYLDAVLVALVLVFAFLTASFPASNGDFFRQLATGRLIAQGQYHFGVDPFTFSAERDYWVNHSWLFALLVYGLYQLPSIGGVAVIVFKAVCVAVLAEVLLRTSRRAGQSLWIPAVCTVLALLAASTRFFMRSDFLSFLFLALTLWLLTAIRSPLSAIRPASGEPTAESGKRKAESGKRLWWLLPPLVVLWVNCDQWFFLGPLTVALFLAGEVLQFRFALDEEEMEEGRRRELVTLGLVLAASLAACLVNPHHVRAFTLPPEFGTLAASDLAQSDPKFRPLFFSPLRQNYYQPGLGLNAAGLAYWPLLVAGLASFVCVFGRAPWWRLLIWLPFALLSLYSARTIPFFAIVAAPITALNWLDFAAGRAGAVPRLTRGRRAWALGGRTLTAVLLLALLVARVPGWLQAQPFETYRVGWGVIADPSLEQAARQIHAWREQGLLPGETHWFNLRPDITNYLAWFAPGERAFIDHRLMQFPEAATDYLQVRNALEQEADEIAAEQGGEAVSLRSDWRRTLRKYGVRFWIFDNSPSLDRPELVARLNLFRDPDEWPLCYLRGRVAIFAWKDRQKEETDPSRGLRLDVERLAFGPDAEPAPPEGPKAEPPSSWWQPWWDAWWKPAPSSSSLDKETALFQEIRFELLTQRYLNDSSRVWQGAVSVVGIGLALPNGPVPNSLLALSWSATYHDLFPPGAMRPSRPPLPRENEPLRARALFVRAQDAGPTDSLYLGVRAARRALQSNPEDAQTYLMLAQLYSHLDGDTQERTLKLAESELAKIRRTQIIAALQNCLRFQPPPRSALQAHGALHDIFKQFGYLDVAVHHLHEFLTLVKQLGPMPGDKPADFGAGIEKITKELGELEGELQRRLNEYHVNAAAKQPLEKARMALDRGLIETALKTLKEAAPSEVKGPNDLEIVSELARGLLDLGRLDEVRDLLLPDAEDAGDRPVSPHYLNHYLRLAAAHGDYALADRYLVDALNYTWKDAQGRPAGIDAALKVGWDIGRVLLAEAQHAAGTPRVPWVPNRAQDFVQSRHPGQAPLGQSPSEFWVRRWRMEALETNLSIEQQRTEMHLLRGWLALEAGHNDQARRSFETVIDLAVPSSRWIPEINRLDVFLYQQEMPALHQINVRQNVARSLAQRYLKWLNANAH